MNTMAATHKPSMSLRFVEREIHEPAPELGPGVGRSRRIRVLQQMKVPEDWNKHEEFWQDVPLYSETDVAV